MLAARWLVLLGTPLALAVVLWIHPHAGDDVFANVEPVADTWFLVHVLLLPLFGLLGVALFLLLSGYRGRVATVGRIGVAIYLVFHTAYEAIAGIAVALAVREAEGLSDAQSEGAGEVVTVLSSDPMVGGLALLGTAGSIVAVGAIAVSLRRDGAPVLPLVLLAGAPVGLVAHGSVPTGPLSVVIFAVGVAWLEFAWGHPAVDESRSDP